MSKELNEMFAEFLQIYKFVNREKIISTLQKELSDEKYKKIYDDIKTVTDELEQGNLVGVKFLRVKQFRVFIAITPFAISVSIEPEVDKSIPLHAQPVHLLLGRKRTIWLRSRSRRQGATEEAQCKKTFF